LSQEALLQKDRQERFISEYNMKQKGKPILQFSLEELESSPDFLDTQRKEAARVRSRQAVSFRWLARCRFGCVGLVLAVRLGKK